MDRWRGKTAVVTGASSGIGAAIAERLVEDGLQVVGLARRLPQLEELSKKLTNRSGKLIPYKCDVTKENDIIAAFQWIDNNLGGADILVNNAGISQLFQDLSDGSTDAWRRVFDVNVIGLCICTREVIKSLKVRKVDGHIVHINSMAGHSLTPISAKLNVYAASKHAVTALTETLRRELQAVQSSQKIKVTSISPGLVETEIIRQADGNIIEPAQNLPIMQPSDIASAVAFAIATSPNVEIQDILIKPI